MNFFLNAALIGVPIARAVEEEHGCNVPWAILMDPTSNCNLRCEGCWAGNTPRSAPQFGGTGRDHPAG